MRIVLPVGQQVSIEFEGTDGCVTVGFITSTDAEAPDGTGLPEGIVVHADLSDVKGRSGIIYHEPFSPPPESEIADVSPCR